MLALWSSWNPGYDHLARAAGFTAPANQTESINISFTQLLVVFMFATALTAVAARSDHADQLIPSNNAHSERPRIAAHIDRDC